MALALVLVLPWSWALTLVLALVLSLVLGLAQVLASGLLSSEPGVSCAPGVPDSGLNQQGAASQTSQPNIDTIREYLLDHRQTVISRVDLA